MFENKLFRDWSGLVGPGRVGNSDNRANLAQVQMNLPTRAKLGNTLHILWQQLYLQYHHYLSSNQETAEAGKILCYFLNKATWTKRLVQY